MNNQENKPTKINYWKYIKILLLILPLGIVGYYGVKFYQVMIYKQSYNIDFREENFRNPNNNIYIDEDLKDIKFGSTIIENGIKYHEILGSPINFVFQPQNYLWNKDLVFSSWFKDKGDWEIKLACDSCSTGDSSVYDWRPFYYGSLENYQIVKKFDGVNIYSKTNDGYKEADNIDQWIKENLNPLDSIDIKDKVYPLTKIINPQVDFQEGKITEIKNTLRGPHQFYVYLRGTLDLEVIKKDLNAYSGADDILVNLYDIEGNQVFSGQIEDDGISSKDTQSFAPPIKKSFVHNIEKEGIYLLTFESTPNAKNDWTIPYIKINTNKIVISGTSLIMDPITLYTEVKQKKDLKFNIWLKDAVQTIKINEINTGITSEVSISAKDTNNDIITPIAPGSYNFQFAGKQYISGANFSFSPEGYFEPFVYDTTSINDPKIILASYQAENDNNWSKVSIEYDSGEIKEALRTKHITIQLRKKKLEKLYSQKKDLIAMGMYPLSNLEEYEIWGKQNPLSYTSNAGDIYQWMRDVIPVGSLVQVDEYFPVTQSDFINETRPSGFNSENNEINFSLKGDINFYVYLENSLNLKLIKDDLNEKEGSDKIDIALFDSKNNQICFDSLGDDGNQSKDLLPGSVEKSTSCTIQKEGVYILRIYEEQDPINGLTRDYLLKQLTINSNKIVAIDQVYSYNSLELYTDNNDARQITFINRNQEQPEQKIEFKGQENSSLTIASKDQGKEVYHDLKTGLIKITSSSGKVYISGSNFAFKAENLFNPEIFTLRDNPAANFTIINNNSSDKSYIKQVSLEVK